VDNARWWQAMRVLQTEGEWREWDHPRPLIRRLEGLVTERKARLFEVACLRRLWEAPEVREYRWVVEVLERSADEPVPAVERESAARALFRVVENATWVMGGMYGQLLKEPEHRDAHPWVMAVQTSDAMVILAGRALRISKGLPDDRPEWDQRLPEERAQCDLLRDIFDNPFRPTEFSPAWLTSDVLALARGIYADKAFDRMPILADALQDTGCDSDEVLNHCRDTSAKHVRGCWVIDRILGKT
jgi:hypothetical protein